MKRLLLGLVTGGLVVVGPGCASDPTGSLVGGVAGLSTSFSYVQVTVADSVAVFAEAKDAQGNTLTALPEVSSADPSIAAVVIADVPPLTQRRFYVKGIAFGQTTITVSAGGLSTEVEVQTYAERIAITGLADTVRSGDVNTITLTALDKAGNPVANVPITVVTTDEDVLALNTTTMEVTAIEAGFASINASGPGGATGTQGTRVIPGPPASAALSATDFGAVAAGGTSTLELVVFDAAGNENHFADEVTGGVTVGSSDEGVATAASAIADTAEDGTRREIFVTATGVASGTANVAGSVVTTSGALPFAAVPVTVLDPRITTTALTSPPAGALSLLGSGFVSTGFETRVLVDGLELANFTVVSNGQIDVEMPTFGAGGDYDVVVEVGGVSSNAATWTQIGDFDEAATDPANDAPGTAPTIGATFRFDGATGSSDVQDFFEFTLTETTTLVIDLDWDTGKDFDVIVQAAATAVPISPPGFSVYNNDVCGTGATSAKPEQAVCEDLAPGTYVVHVIDFDGGWSGVGTATVYTVTGQRQ